MDLIKQYCLIVIFVICVASNNHAEDVPASRKPKILNGNETTILAGDNYTLTCEGDDDSLKWTTPEKLPDANWANIRTENATLTANGKYISRLIIQNISYLNVGFYSCRHETTEENSSKIYLFVKDYNHLSIIHEFRTVFVSQYMPAIIPCRPTFLDVKVKLVKTGSPHDEVPLNKLNEDGSFNSYSPYIGFSTNNTANINTQVYQCEYSVIKNDGKEIKSSPVYVKVDVKRRVKYLKKPAIRDKTGGHITVGDKLVLRCTIETYGIIEFNWITPAKKDHRITISNTESLPDRKIQELVINPTTLADSGEYYCNVEEKLQLRNNSNKINIRIFDRNEHFINLNLINNEYYQEQEAGNDMVVRWTINVDAHPKPNIIWLDNENKIITNLAANKYKISNSEYNPCLEIKDVKITDFGNYTITANNGYETRSNVFFLNVTDKPTVEIEIDNFHMINKYSTVKCIGTGNPQPNISWSFKQSCSNCSFESIPDLYFEQNGFRFISTARINASKTGYIKCLASNSLGRQNDIKGFHITDIQNGFDIFDVDKNIEKDVKTNKLIVAKGENIAINCAGSKTNYTNIRWVFNNKTVNPDGLKYTVTPNSTAYSNLVLLTVWNLNLSDSGFYECESKFNNNPFTKSIEINVTDPQTPFIKATNMYENVEWKLPNPGILFCQFSGIPKPSIVWLKNNEVIKPTDRIKFSQNLQNLTFVHTEEIDEGIYECRIENRIGRTSRSVDLKFTNKPGLFANKWVNVIIGFLMMLVTLAIIYILIKIRNEKKLRRELEIAGLANFEEGAIENLNPDIGIDDQAELLPYDKKWEFPIEKLILGKQLGSGAFGVVLKAEAKGILEKGVSTTVAVKMVKRNTDYTHIKSLASELKIMVHLGKHLNVVNLLGACTKNVARKEIWVIVEYCRYGNLHNYLLRHRRSFINQIDVKTGMVDSTIAQDLLMRTYSGSERQSISCQSSSSMPNNKMNDYRDKRNYTGATEKTDITLLSMNQTSELDENTTISSNTSTSQEQWCSNYKGDYKGSVKPICTQDLLIWSFQVSKGMNYLASRRVLHGDLAARNILLSDDNVVKICDFGLAKNMFKSDNYQKRTQGLLPVKWMAIESIKDRIFSTQSDIWSFGIVLWEFFSLAETPYPGMQANDEFFKNLVNGYRMDQPKFAPNAIYKLMQNCWQSQPNRRPSFEDLSDKIGAMLEESVKTHYIDLNDPYLMMNTQRLGEGQSDYLAMLNSPTFENLSSPNYDNDMPCNAASPHQITPGYLPMAPSSVFSPRADSNGTVFNFNHVAAAPHPNEQSIDIGLVPIKMLPLNGVPCCKIPNTATQLLSTVDGFSNPSYQLVTAVDSADKGSQNIVKSTDNYINMPQNKNVALNSHHKHSNIEQEAFKRIHEDRSMITA